MQFCYYYWISESPFIKCCFVNEKIHYQTEWRYYFTRPKKFNLLSKRWETCSFTKINKFTRHKLYSFYMLFPFEYVGSLKYTIKSCFSNRRFQWISLQILFWNWRRSVFHWCFCGSSLIHYNERKWLT